jgi:hypothetical protein
VYMSEIDKKDAKPTPTPRTRMASSPSAKWQHNGSNKQVDGGTGTGNTARACVKGVNKQVDDGTRFRLRSPFTEASRGGPGGGSGAGPAIQAPSHWLEAVLLLLGARIR